MSDRAAGEKGGTMSDGVTRQRAAAEVEWTLIRCEHPDRQATAGVYLGPVPLPNNPQVVVVEKGRLESVEAERDAARRAIKQGQHEIAMYRRIAERADPEAVEKAIEAAAKAMYAEEPSYENGSQGSAVWRVVAWDDLLPPHQSHFRAMARAALAAATPDERKD